MKDNEKQTNEEKDNLQDEQKNNPKNAENIDPEVLEKIVSELEEKYNLKKENIKILKVQTGPSKPKLYMLILRDILFWIMDFLVILALQGYLKFTENNLLKLFLFSLCIYIIEFVIRIIITRYYQRLIIYSFGTIMIPVTVISIVLSHLAVNLAFTNSDKMIAFFVLFIIFRVVIKFLIMRKEIVTVMRGRRK